MICLAVIHNTPCAIIVISTPKIPLKQYLQSCAAITDMELGWKYASFSRYMWKHAERLHHEGKKLLKLKIKSKSLWVCSQLCRVPFSSPLSSPPAQAVLGLGHKTPPACCCLQLAELEGRKVLHFQHPVSWDTRTIMWAMKEEGNLLLLFQH